MEEVIVGVSFGLLSALITKRIKTAHLKKCDRAICVFDAEFSKIRGHVLIEAIDIGFTKFTCNISNLLPGKHGFHIHEKGDLREKCKNACAHYNPDKCVHGSAKSTIRHKGDLGNILADDNHECTDTIVANVDINEIIGRSIVIHEKEDDLGLGNDEESLKTGNAGARIACGVIGRL